MSGIYGFTIRADEAALREEALDGLRYWNHIYGTAAEESHLVDCAGLGCHMEHFSDRFPHGGPILAFDGGEAVIDALLYNRDELLPLVQMSDDSSISDEALLLRLIREKGWDVLAQVNGDFAGALLDTRTGEWTLFRDHLGVRPLYYYHDDSRFIFSTDIRGIAAVPGVRLTVNLERLYASLTFCNPLSLQDTDYREIRCALPGALTHIRAGERGFLLKERSYWSLRRRRIRLGSDEAYAEKMRELVTDSVERRLAAIPGLVGAELSGGLDSGVVDILISRAGREGCYFSWSPGTDELAMAPGDDERKIIRDICDQEGIACHFLGAENFGCGYKMYERVVPPYINTLQLSYGSRWMRSQGARVCFTGHGGDEGVSHRASPFELLYHGELLSYLRLFYMYLEGRPLRLLKTLYAGAMDALRRCRSICAPLYQTNSRSSILCEACNERMLRRFRNVPLYFSVDPKRYIMQGGSRGRFDNTAFQGAAAGVRYVFPFADHRVMDFAVSVPRHLYLTPEGNRMLYRNAFDDLMPRSLARVNFKDFPSMRDLPTARMDDETVIRDREYILSLLDPDFWEGILDLEAISRRMQPEDPDSDEARTFRNETYELYRCILIQNTALMAKNWRDIDEHPDLL